MKIKNFENIMLKVLKCVRTHAEELLVRKHHFFLFWRQECILGPYDENEKCREYHFENSEMCKNSSWRTSRRQNNIFTFFEDKNAFLHHMMIMKSVSNMIYKLMKCVKINPKEPLVNTECLAFWRQDGT